MKPIVISDLNQPVSGFKYSINDIVEIIASGRQECIGMRGEVRKCEMHHLGKAYHIMLENGKPYLATERNIRLVG